MTMGIGREGRTIEEWVFLRDNGVISNATMVKEIAKIKRAKGLSDAEVQARMASVAQGRSVTSTPQPAPLPNGATPSGRGPTATPTPITGPVPQRAPFAMGPGGGVSMTLPSGESYQMPTAGVGGVGSLGNLTKILGLAGLLGAGAGVGTTVAGSMPPMQAQDPSTLQVMAQGMDYGPMRGPMTPVGGPPQPVQPPTGAAGQGALAVPQQITGAVPPRPVGQPTPTPTQTGDQVAPITQSGDIYEQLQRAMAAGTITEQPQTGNVASTMFDVFEQEVPDYVIGYDENGQPITTTALVRMEPQMDVMGNIIGWAPTGSVRVPQLEQMARERSTAADELQALQTKLSLLSALGSPRSLINVAAGAARTRGEEYVPGVNVPQALQGIFGTADVPLAGVGAAPLTQIAPGQVAGLQKDPMMMGVFQGLSDVFGFDVNQLLQQAEDLQFKGTTQPKVTIGR